MIYAVIPAAGQARRMGRPKLLLPIGDKTVIEMVISALANAGVDSVMVVVGPGMDVLAARAQAAGAQVGTLPTTTADMRATVEFGLQSIEVHHNPPPDDAWLLLPGDHPAVETETISRLLRARQCQRDHSIFIPTFQGQRGHPVLIAWKHVAFLRNFPSEHGINSYLRQHAGETLELPVESDSILLDLDSPDDYAKLVARFGTGGT